ncbi:Disease resistance protein RML1A [Vitis vinifera]|uniref:ADP-ribosyl cyclase/cyclic ADP-ribose hydrolase n=1 Tax=Vitis vinifera TaxID=29760 RepID=A0A438FVV3_VITVI|nr:Disease resistance protein RML1A [Vitis vinifera]
MSHGRSRNYRDVLHEMISKHCNEDGLVGKEHHLEALKALILEPKDVLMVGIHGHSGTGKTTIARALYDEISCQFEGASFLANIGDVSKEDDLRCLQERLFCDILFGANQEIRQFHKENNVMKDKICSKNVLIILDDVNNVKQLEILAGKHDWFGKGSRIIITTKNEYLLRQHKVDELYGIKELATLEALQLFNHHANTKGESLYEFYPLSTEVIKHCGLHPLDLKVVGSFLRDKSYSQWQFQLGKLARESDRENLGIRVPHNRFRKKVVDEQYNTRIGVANCSGSRQTLPHFGSYEYPTPIEDRRVFAKMTELKLVKVFLGSDWVDGRENYKVSLPPNFGLPCFELRYLHWHGYQLESYPSHFEAVELLELNMPYSCLKQINGNEIHFPKLTTLNLSHSQQLETISNFSRMPNLERLVLEGCRSLVKVDPSIGNLNKLSLMNLKDCKRLKSLPKRICEFEFLETLILAGCSRLEKLLGDWEERQSSVNLKASRTYRRVIILPPKLRILHLGHCKRFQEILKLPSSIQEVDAYNCISMGTLSWNTRLGASILQRIKINPESAFSIVLPGNTIPDCWVTHKVTGSSVTMTLKNPDRYNDDFLGFAVCLVFAPLAEKPQLNPEILCELKNFTFFYCCGEDSVDEFPESDQEWGNNSTDHVWLAYRPHARADRCHPKDWNHIKASFEVFDCVVKKCAIRLIYK